jgi:hypothetical protein
MCPRRDSNPQGVSHRIESPARIPISPRGRVCNGAGAHSGPSPFKPQPVILSGLQRGWSHLLIVLTSLCLLGGNLVDDVECQARYMPQELGLAPARLSSLPCSLAPLLRRHPRRTCLATLKPTPVPESDGRRVFPGIGIERLSFASRLIDQLLRERIDVPRPA